MKRRGGIEVEEGKIEVDEGREESKAPWKSGFVPREAQNPGEVCLHRKRDEHL